eukprot:scaffold21607_cov146-Isochrysis_galbana.AAC.2
MVVGVGRASEITLDRCSVVGTIGALHPTVKDRNTIARIAIAFGGGGGIGCDPVRSAAGRSGGIRVAGGVGHNSGDGGMDQTTDSTWRGGGASRSGGDGWRGVLSHIRALGGGEQGRRTVAGQVNDGSATGAGTRWPRG